MKHAFLIEAHDNIWQLQILIKLLDSFSHDIYIHFDKKAGKFDEEVLYSSAKLSNVYVYQEYKVYWGHYSQIQVELFLFQKAHDNYKYDYYHVLSGQDLPLKNNKQIDFFFEKYCGFEFIQFDHLGSDYDESIINRIKIYHFLQKYKKLFKNNWLNSIVSFIEKCLLLVQIVFRIDRLRKIKNLKIEKGGNWVSITNDLVETILEKKTDIIKLFKFSNCGDELFVQMIAYNYGFIDKLYSVNGRTSNLRLIDWSMGGKNPRPFGIDDLNELCNTNAIFARKFSEKFDKDIIEIIYKKIKKI